MHFQFLIEDQSCGILIQILMSKIIDNNPDVTFDCKSFRGIGGFTKKNTVKETKTGKLLNDLATYLKGFDKSLQGIPAAIVVVVDNDDRDTHAFRRELQSVAASTGIRKDHVFCIAIEEVEAWLLGDREAVLKAYPKAKIQVLNSYRQDSICGTWELLADAVYPGGHSGLKKERTSYTEIGECKIEWCKNIGMLMNPERNLSPSFQFFVGEINKRITAV